MEDLPTAALIFIVIVSTSAVFMLMVIHALWLLYRISENVAFVAEVAACMSQMKKDATDVSGAD